MNYILYVLAGAMTWTLAEYLLHRFLGHELVHFKKYSKFYREHAKHHFVFNYFVGPKEKALAFLKTGPFIFLIVYFITNSTGAILFTLSFLSMFLVYELIHKRLHEKAPPHAFASAMRSHHLAHHFENERQNYGVTTNFWDRVFGTYVQTEEVRIPKKFKLKWLNSEGPEVQCDKYGKRYRII